MYAAKACFQVSNAEHIFCILLTRESPVDASVIRDLQAHRSLDDSVPVNKGGS